MKKFEVRYIDDGTIVFNGQYLHPIEHEGSRLVFVSENYVVKCDNWTLDGKRNYWKQCWREWQHYHKFKNTKYKNNFVPVLQSGKINNHWYVVQPKVKIANDNEYTNEISKRAIEISREFNLCDVYGYNYTVFNGDILIYDYAY